MNSAQHNLGERKQREKQRALALAALAQVTSLVESIAQEGKCDQQQFTCCMDAFLHDNYTENMSFPAGAIKSKRLLQGQTIPHAKHMLAHTASLVSLEKKLMQHPDKLKSIASGMQRIQKQVQYFNDPYHANIVAAIAHLYGENISDMTPKVMVRGKPEHLTPSQREKIRCLLFSGIRAAWVWRTNGGNTMRLLFGRKKLIQQLEKLRAPTA